ncbi:MAG: carboxypeptidase-like regulatory domain-containing protein [Vicinamibacterales bacterium]
MSRFVLVLGLVAALSGTALAQAADFTGRVFDADSKDGLQNLQVKLTPPRQVKAPIRIATTDREGGFSFRRLLRGRYLVEVSQGTTLLYRAEVDTTKTSSLQIPLKRRRD